MPKPKMRISTKCKVCKVFKFDSGIFNEIHTLRFKNNYILEDISKELEVKLAEKNYPKDLIPNIQNLSMHFRLHIPVEKIVQYKIQTRKKLTSKAKEERAVSDETKNQANALVDGKIELYDRLENLYDILNERFQSFDKVNNHVMNANNYDGYSNITKELRSMVSDLNKMKQSEQLVKTVVGVAFSTYTTKVFQEVLKEIEKIKVVLKVYIRDRNTVDSLINGMESNIGSYFIEASKETLEAVKAQFKL